MTHPPTTPGSLVALLRRQGHRITKARDAICALMEGNDRPLAAADVHALLRKKHVKTDKVTVYRELQFLESQGILASVPFADGVTRYEAAALPHHHHLICTGCQRIEDIEVDHDFGRLERRIRTQKSFLVERHSLEFYGLCAKCAL